MAGPNQEFSSVQHDKIQVSRFLDLPAEVKTLVYRAYYGTSETTITMRDAVGGSTKSVTSNTRAGISYTNVPTFEIEQVNREIRHDARKVKDAYLPRVLNIDCTSFTQRFRWLDEILPLATLRTPWLQSHIEELRIYLCSGIRFLERRWKSVLRSLPNLKCISLNNFNLDKNCPCQSLRSIKSWKDTFASTSEAVFYVKWVTELEGVFQVQRLTGCLEELGMNVLVRLRYHMDRRSREIEPKYEFERRQVAMETYVLVGSPWKLNIRTMEGDTESDLGKFGQFSELRGLDK